MEESNSNQMLIALQKYKRSNIYSLDQAYEKASSKKDEAFKECKELAKKYKGQSLKIISKNSYSFSVGFIGKINKRRAFFFITRTYI